MNKENFNEDLKTELSKIKDYMGIVVGLGNSVNCILDSSFEAPYSSYIGYGNDKREYVNFVSFYSEAFSEMIQYGYVVADPTQQLMTQKMIAYKRTKSELETIIK